MTQMSCYETENRLTDKESRLVVAKGKGLGEERTGDFGLTDANPYIQNA